MSKQSFITILLSVLMSMTGAKASAHDIEAAYNGKTIYYVWTNNNTELAVSYRGSSYDSYNEYTGNVVIPESVDYNGNTYPVTSIGNYTFWGCSGLTYVTIPNNVKSIGFSAFRDCSGLSSITIPNSVTSIGYGAFWDCSGLTSITIPNSVTSIGNDVFTNCSGLTSIKVENGNQYYDSRNNCNAIIKTASNTLFVGCKNTTIPNSVTSIGRDAFYKCSGLTSITIPNSVTSIGQDAFYYCSSLTSMTIGNSVTSIGEDAFRDCSGLISITIPNSVKSIGDHAFGNCSGLTSINVKTGNQYYDSRNNCNAIIETASNTLILGCKNTIIPNSVTSIGDGAFWSCSGLTSVTIPNSVTSIASNAFNGCSGLNSINVVSGNPNYDSRNNCNAIIRTASNTLILGCKNTIIPNSVTSIGIFAFYECSGLTSVTIPNSVTSIGSAAFEWCSGLTSITIPNSVTSIGNNAFSGCSKLSTIISEIETPFKIGAIAGTSITLIVPVGKKAAYQSTAGWSSFTNIFEVGEGGDVGSKFEIDGICYTIEGNNTASLTSANKGISGAVVIPEQVEFNGKKYDVTSIGNNAFRGCSGLTSVTIPNSVTSIDGWAFYDCSGLTSVTIPNSVTSIGYEAFYGCSGLTSVTIPNSVTSIGEHAFLGCSGLTSVTIPNSVTSIGGRVFIGCSGLTSVTIGNSMTSIGNGAFMYCSGLTSVTIPNSVTSIGYQAFWGCSGLTSVTIGNSVTSIGDNAFDGCSGLTSVTIPNSVTSIGRGAFYGCSGLTSVTIPNSVTSIGNYAFDGCSGLTSVTIPNSVTSISYGAFSDCSGLTSVTIPNSVTSIGDYAFSGCSGLSSVTIPNSVTSIGSCAFYGCSGLTSVVSLNNEPLRCDDLDIFYEVEKNSCVLWVPKGSLAAYKNADDWKDFQNIKELVHGDVNLDSEVNHGDLNAIVDYVMGKDPIDFYESLGDLNGDDMVDAADVVLQVDAIMKADEYSKNKAPANVEAVDLGLPKGTKWANMNVGAESPEDCGLYFAWGETAGYTSDTSDGRLFNWASYKWMNKGQSVGSQVNKYQIADGHTADCWYNSEAKFIGDGKTKLDLEDDAAYVNWGADWCMPTSLDFQELFDNTTYEWTTLNDVYGLRFTSKTNGNSIFLPAAGDRVNSGFYDLSTDGCYWSSSLHVFDSSSASFLIFNWISNNPISMASRSYGLTVRPVLRINP